MAAKEMISLRVWRDDLERWKAAAKQQGVDRSTWMNTVLNNATTTTPPGGGVSVAEGRESSQGPRSETPP